jgi:hypothetical protein
MDKPEWLSALWRGFQLFGVAMGGHAVLGAEHILGCEETARPEWTVVVPRPRERKD